MKRYIEVKQSSENYCNACGKHKEDKSMSKKALYDVSFVQNCENGNIRKQSFRICWDCSKTLGLQLENARERTEKKLKNKNRIIQTNILDMTGKKQNLLCELSVQLADGYWEGEENFYKEFWNWLKFDEDDYHLVIIVKPYPTWEDTNDIFINKTDEEVIHYVGEVLENCYDEAPHIFSDYEDIVEATIQKLKNYC